MTKVQNVRIKALGFALSGISLFYLTFTYIAYIFAFLILIIPLASLFPALVGNGLYILKYFPFVTILLLHILCYFHTVVLEPDTVILKWFGIPTGKLSVSNVKLLCAVGNEREDVLCLSCYSVKELAQMQEGRLLRSFYTKHDVPFRKRKADWEQDFAREYLNNLRKNPFYIFRKRGVIMLKMNPAVLCSIRQLYPQLPYKNYTEVTSRHVSSFSGFQENQAVCFSSRLHAYKVAMEIDGIHIFAGKKEYSFTPAGDLKTAVRVDIFKGYDRHHPHHTPLLFITTMSEEQLASHTSSKGYSGFRLADSANQALRSMTAAMYLTLHWGGNLTSGCAIYHTEKNLDALRALYPHVQINEIAASWLENSGESLD